MRKVGIVGSSETHWTPERRTEVVKEIKNILTYLESPSDMLGDKLPFDPDNVILVSGGCPHGGVDIWAEIVADVLEIQKEIYLPEVGRWEDIPYSNIPPKKGYKSRNIEIAKACDVLYCIDPKGRIGGGGQWTHKYAQSIGKEAHHILIE